MSDISIKKKLMQEIKMLEDRKDSYTVAIKELELKLSATIDELENLLKVRQYITTLSTPNTKSSESPQLNLGFQEKPVSDLQIQSCLQRNKYLTLNQLMERVKRNNPFLTEKELDDAAVKCSERLFEGVQYKTVDGVTYLKLPKKEYKQPSRKNKYLNFARKYLRSINATSSATAIARGTLYKEMQKRHPEWANPHNSGGARLHEVMAKKINTEIFHQEKYGGEVYIWVNPL